MQEVQPDNMDETHFFQVPDDWKPDAATLDFIAQIVTQEIVRRGNRHGMLAKGSDRHENEGAMLVLQSLVLGLVDVRNKIANGTFGQTEKETESEPSIIVSA